MATRLYGISIGEAGYNVAEGVGSATSADNIELTVDLAVVTTREQALRGLKKIEEWIVTHNWPPA